MRLPGGDREKGELVRILYRNVPVATGCMVFGGTLLCVGLYYLAPQRWPGTHDTHLPA